MKLRRLCAAATAVAAVFTVAGCRTNVGVAATIDGHQVSESSITSYLTSDAKAVNITGSNGSANSVDPRPFVLQVLIQHQLFLKLLSKTPAGKPGQAQLDKLVAHNLKGSSLDAAVAKLGVTGYTTDLDRTVVEVQQFATVLNAEVQRGVDVNKLATNLRFPVSVNPRYGAWNASTFSLETNNDAGVPAFVKLQPTPATGTSAAAGN